MTETALLIPMVLLTALAALTGALFAQLRAQREIARLREEKATLETTLELAQRGYTEKMTIIERAREQLTESLKDGTQEFLRLAQENLTQWNRHARQDDHSVRTPLEDLLSPIKEAVDRVVTELEGQIPDLDQINTVLKQQIQNLSELQQSLHRERHALIHAAPGSSGPEHPGPASLLRLAGMAQVLSYCECPAATGSHPGHPDMVLHLPYDRVIAIDAHAPLDAYRDILRAPEEGVRAWHLERHARAVRERVRELASHTYLNRVRPRPIFIVTYVPSDDYLDGALDIDADLLDYALREHVIFASPGGMFHLLQAAGVTWRLKELADQFQRVQATSDDLRQQLEHYHHNLNGNLGTQHPTARPARRQ